MNHFKTVNIKPLGLKYKKSIIWLFGLLDLSKKYLAQQGVCAETSDDVYSLALSGYSFFTEILERVG